MKNTIKAVLALAICINLTALSASAKDLKFAHITDSHFSTASAEHTQAEVEESQKTLEQTICDINTIKNLDFVVFGGDNIDKANPDDLKRFLQIANKLNVPYYIVIGNHEVFKSQNLTKKDYMEMVSKYSKGFKPKSANYAFTKEGIVFLVVDGAKEIIPGPAGYYKKDTLKWLDKELTKYQKNKVVILQHFPVVEPYYNRSHTTYNVASYLEVLGKHKNVIAILSGHYHANAEVEKDGIYHISTPALVEPPHKYKIVDLKTDKNKNVQIYTQLRNLQ